MINFVVFTGMVYYLGRTMGNGTGTWDEVAYTFSLFIAPLAVVFGALSFIMALLGGIPVLGGLIGFAGGVASLIVVLAQVYFGYLAVQSSMNIHDQTKAIVVLVLAGVATVAAQIVMLALGSILWGILPVVVLVALVAIVGSMIMGRRGRR